MTAKPIDGLRQLAPRYDAFLLDQFGVLHDGTVVYPGVVDCLEALKNADKRVVILSNSGTRQAANRDRLRRLGIADELYEEIVTSGEVTRAYLASTPPELRPASDDSAPLRCRPLGGPAERAILVGLPVQEVESVEEADFLLLASFSHSPPAREAFDEVLTAARRRGLALVCANPDVSGVSPNGLILAPGALAADYEAAGGRVVYIGKPHPLIYRHVLRSLMPIAPARVLAIGDSLAHDIAGATGVGLASALVIAGIHREELGDPAEDGTFESRLAALQRQHHATPDYLLRRLNW
ncbi:MAG: TIGR01459 family HAD-type hydrolase [Kiloniellaceae bacterium]